MESFFDYAVIFLVYVMTPSWFILSPLFSSKYKFIPNRRARWGLLYSIIVIWLLLILCSFIYLSIPSQSDDPLADGTGLVAVSLLSGWLIGFVISVPYLVIRYIIETFIIKKQTEQAAAPDP